MSPAAIVRFVSQPWVWKLFAIIAVLLGAYHTADLRLQATEIRIGVVERDTGAILESQKEIGRRVQEIAERTARMEGARGAAAPVPATYGPTAM